MRRVAILTCLLIVAAPAWGYLRVHPDNPHYFQESTTGAPVMIASCAGVVPTSFACSYGAQIAEMRAKHITYGRVWHLLPWDVKAKVVWPWARSKVPGAHMGGRGGNKFDFNTWDPEYWHRIRDSMSRCNAAGIYCEIHLFERCGMSPAAESRWGNNPWASDNNINDLETPDSSKDGTPDFYMYADKPNLRRQQERYVRKMIDETIKFPNMIYEIENEHWQYNNPDWAAYWGRFVKDYIARKSPRSPRLVSYSSLEDDMEAFYDRTEVDIINRHFGNEAERNPDVINTYIEPRWAKSKPINIDEFANGVDDLALLRRMCWVIVTSGGNFHIEDCKPEAKPFDICENIRRFRVESKWDFVHSAPNKQILRSAQNDGADGYCMADPGKEYVSYFPKGGSATIKLEPGNYIARWWNTTKGGFSEPTAFSHKEGQRSFTTPDEGDWVLHTAKWEG